MSRAKLIGHGQSGCVYQAKAIVPKSQAASRTCLGEESLASQTHLGTDYMLKYAPADDLREELYIARRLRQIDSHGDYFAVLEETCDMPSFPILEECPVYDSSKRYIGAYLKYAGVPVDKYFHQHPDMRTAPIFISVLKQLLEAVTLMGINSIYHLDLAYRNVLVMDTPSGDVKVRIIDFGRSLIIPSEFEKQKALAENQHWDEKPPWMAVAHAALKATADMDLSEPTYAPIIAHHKYDPYRAFRIECNESIRRAIYYFSQIDVWSIAVMMANLVNNYRVQINPTYTDVLVQLINTDPEKVISTTQALYMLSTILPASPAPSVPGHVVTPVVSPTGSKKSLVRSKSKKSSWFSPKPFSQIS